MNLYYDKDGAPISIQSWATLFEMTEYQIIKQDEAKDGSWVSTVWMGVCRAGEKKPRIFETLAFRERGSEEILEGRQYSTLALALQGHEEILKMRDEAPRHHLRKVEI